MISTAVTIGLVLCVVALLWTAIGLNRQADRISSRFESKSVSEKEPPDYSQVGAAIDIAALPEFGPDTHLIHLQMYNTPVRIAVFVLAPLGRHQLPEKWQLPDVVDTALPGLRKVLGNDQPIYRAWPSQVSASGFTQAFFNAMSLPGDRGKGTPWSSAAGRFLFDGQPMLLGLVCCAERENGFGQVEIKQEAQWLDVFRIQRHATT